MATDQLDATVFEASSEKGLQYASAADVFEEFLVDELFVTPRADLRVEVDL